MKNELCELIKDKAARSRALLSSAKWRTLACSLYAGPRVLIDGISIKAAAREMGYSPTGVAKMVRKWQELKAVRDKEVLAIEKAYSRMVGKLPAPPPPELVPLPSNPRLQLFGFAFTQDDEERMAKAMRGADNFMEKYGKGQQPRLHGEYYAPNPASPNALYPSERWLTEQSAALYCGCSVAELAQAAKEGIVERRIYRRVHFYKRSDQLYYEYKVESLDLFNAKRMAESDLAATIKREDGTL